MADLDFAGLNARLLSNARSIIPSWLPGGRMRGHEYVCGGLQGGKGESFSVNLTTGRWGEFAGTERGGDLVSLYAAIHGVGQGDAFKALDDGRSLTSTAAPVAPVAPNPAPSRLGPPPPDAPAPSALKGAEAFWLYRQDDGTPWFYVTRYPGKVIRPLAWDLDQDAWVWKGLPKPRPLYGLELLAARPDAPVMVVEGEKAADAARIIAGHVYVVVTWPNGAAGTGAADWTPLHGRKVLLWPDADEPGSRAAATIADGLHPHCPEVKVLDPEQGPDGHADGWDAADALAQGWAWDRFAAWARPRASVWAPPAAPSAPSEPPIDEVQVLTPEVVPSVPTARLDVSLSTQDDQAELPASLAAIYSTYTIDFNSKGIAETNADNIHRCLSRVPGFTELAHYDEFYETMFKPDGTEWTDADTSRLLIRFQRDLGFKRLSTGAVLDGLLVYAHERKRNAPRDWMETLIWDGKARLEAFLPGYMGAEDNEYTRAAGRNWWISMVARIYEPGCKVDTMLILKGEQGRFKSTAFEVIGGPWYAVATADVDDPKAFAETMRGKMILELAELASFGKAEADSIKRLLTDRADRFRASYGRFAADHPRRCVLVGTTNKGVFLSDETGARRFWPVRIDTCDLDALRRDREQLFAEAVHRFKAGESWWDMPVSTLAEQENSRDHDELETQVGDFIEHRNAGVTIHEIWTEGLKFSLQDLKRHEQLRISKILRALRWDMQAKPVKRNGSTVRIWLPMDPPF